MVVTVVELVVNPSFETNSSFKINPSVRVIVGLTVNLNVVNEDNLFFGLKITDVEDVRKKEHEAKVDATFARRQLKSAVTSFDGIIERWESQDKKGLKTPLKRAIRQLIKIQKMLDEK